METNTAAIPEAIERWLRSQAFRPMSAGDAKRAPEFAILSYTDDERWRWHTAYFCTKYDEEGCWLQFDGAGMEGVMSDVLKTPADCDAEMARREEAIDENETEREAFIVAEAFGL